MLTAERGLQRLRHGLCFETKVQEARARDLDLLAPLADFKLGQDIRGELARIHLPRLGDGHQGVRLVIAELRIGTGTDEERSRVGIRKNGGDGDAKFVFENLVEH